MVRKTELKVDLSHFNSFSNMLYFIHPDLISSLFDIRYDPSKCKSKHAVAFLLVVCIN